MTLETTRLLGTAATLYGLGGALSVLLQARRMHVRGTSGDVSARFFAVYVGGFAVWLLYGLSIGDVPIIVVHAVGLVCGIVTLAVVLRLREPTAVAATTWSVGEDPLRPNWREESREILVGDAQGGRRTGASSHRRRSPRRFGSAATRQQEGMGGEGSRRTCADGKCPEPTMCVG